MSQYHDPDSIRGRKILEGFSWDFKSQNLFRRAEHFNSSWFVWMAEENFKSSRKNVDPPSEFCHKTPHSQ